MIRLELRDWQDVARISDALVEAAEACEAQTPAVARTYKELADRIEDELSACPSSVFRAEVALARARRADSVIRADFHAPERRLAAV